MDESLNCSTLRVVPSTLNRPQIANILQDVLLVYINVLSLTDSRTLEVYEHSEVFVAVISDFFQKLDLRRQTWQTFALIPQALELVVAIFPVLATFLFWGRHINPHF